jgi:hypothetical protein
MARRTARTLSYGTPRRRVPHIPQRWRARLRRVATQCRRSRDGTWAPLCILVSHRFVRDARADANQPTTRATPQSTDGDGAAEGTRACATRRRQTRDEAATQRRPRLRVRRICGGEASALSDWTGLTSGGTGNPPGAGAPGPHLYLLRNTICVPMLYRLAHQHTELHSPLQIRQRG